MATYNIHAGHCPQGKGASGAVGILQESVEDRLVKNEVIAQLKAAGHTVYDCTCDDAVSANECLKRIVQKCNAHSVDLDVSIHLNSGRNDYKGDNSTGGTEVFCYNSKTYDVAQRIAENIAKEFGYRLRSDGTSPAPGVKVNQKLYVLRKTNAKAILIECCFVDDLDDARVWNAARCGKAIAEAIMETSLSDTISQGNGTPGKNPDASAYETPDLEVDGKWGAATTKALQKAFGTVQDGKVSNQRKKHKQPGCYTGWEWEDNPKGYSDLIKAMQRKVGVKEDGWIGPTTIKALQGWMGTVQDGKISKESDLVKALQRWCRGD